MFIYVLRTPDVSAVAQELLERGWTLTPEKHGDGPEHFSSFRHGALYEIYPATKTHACDRCAGFVAEDRPTTVCRRCFDELGAQLRAP